MGQTVPMSQAAKAGAKAAGVVIDDTAVTPGYVIGFEPRVGRCAKPGS